MLAALKAKSKAGKAFAAALAVFHSFWAPALIGGLLGATLPVVLFVIFRGPLVPYIVLGVLWVALSSCVVAAAVAIKNGICAISSNDFGLCSGFDPRAPAGGPPLTGWMHEQIQKAAGRTYHDDPLTFGNLWNAQPYPRETLKTVRVINLQVVTTSLTQGRPFTIPFESGAFYFDKQEFERLLPSGVVEWMVQRAPKEEDHPIQSHGGRPLSRLPHANDMPIVFAARMSLSFPILLSAIPLYAVDYTRKQNQNVSIGQPLVAERCWFSDGGICSNFPIQFFDSPLPRWPTFGIN